MKPARSRFLLFIARWAILSGLAGIVFTVLVFRDRAATQTDSQRGLLLAAAVLLSVAFILAPFVRRAFAGPARATPAASKSKTLLEEMRERPESDEFVTANSPALEEPAPAPVLPRVIVALYVVFAVALGVIFWSL